MITHFTKRAVLDVAMRANCLGACDSYNEPKSWGSLAKQNSIVALHISERDSQIGTKGRRINEYVNTWSIDGLLEESLEYKALAWGTHEKKPKILIKNQVYNNTCRMMELKRISASVQVKSWVPGCGNFHGFAIPHPEAFSIAELFALRNKNNVPIYHPTVHFVYQPCNDALVSIHDALVEQKGRLLIIYRYQLRPVSFPRRRESRNTILA